jgi:hypothetical protein
MLPLILRTYARPSTLTEGAPARCEASLSRGNRLDLRELALRRSAGSSCTEVSCARIRACPRQRAWSPCGRRTPGSGVRRFPVAKACWRVERYSWVLPNCGAGAQHSQSPIRATGGAVMPNSLRLINVSVYLKSTQECGDMPPDAGSGWMRHSRHTPAGRVNHSDRICRLF